MEPNITLLEVFARLLRVADNGCNIEASEKPWGGNLNISFAEPVGGLMSGGRPFQRSAVSLVGVALALNHIPQKHHKILRSSLKPLCLA